MSGWGSIALSASLLVVACGSKKKSKDESGEAPAAAGRETDSGSPAAGHVADLWALAPTEATFGIVVNDGALVTVLDAWAELARVMDGNPFTKALAERLRGRMLATAPVASLDPAALRGAGLDLGRGVAVFLDAELAPLLLALPVADPDTFIAAIGGAKQSLGFRDVYRTESPALVCAEKAGRFLCARDLALIVEARASRKRPLTARLLDLPEILRGDIEVVGDLARIPDLERAREHARIVLADAGLVVLALRLRAGRAALRVWIQGKPMPPWGTAYLDPSPLAALVELEKGAVGGVRFRLNTKQLLSIAAPEPASLGDGLDLRRDFMDLLTGDVGLYTRGRGAFAGVIALGVEDEKRMRKAIPGLCNLLFRPLGRIERLADGRCDVVLQLPQNLSQDPVARVFLAGLSRVPAKLSVKERLLLLEIGDTEVSERARRLLRPLGEGRWQLAAWAYSLDPLATAQMGSGPLAAKLASSPDREQRAAISGVRWLLGHVAEIGGGLRFGELLEPGSARPLRLVGGGDTEGLHSMVSATAFVADPPDAYVAYEAALHELHSGDRSAYFAAMAEIARAFPDTLAGLEAVLVAEGAPMFGPGATLLTAWGFRAFQSYSEPSPPGRRRGNRR